MTIDPLQLQFYKGMGGRWGAVQFKPQPPHYYCANSKCPGIERADGKRIKAKDWESRFAGKCPACGEEMKSREGAIFVEITSAIGKNVYDWPSKVRMALSVPDLGKLLHFLETAGPEGELLIQHDPGAGSNSKGQVMKRMNFQTKEGPAKGVMMYVSQNEGEDTKKHTVPLAGDEVKILAACIRDFIPKALGW